jgi:dTDP-4-amino-4,6-dideoxygalactose transaminase
VFSFHATKLLSAAEGGCITTEEDDLAERIRNMRSNYGIRSPREVPLTINARMSEAQAALALMSLDDLNANRARNESLWQTYRESLEATPGLTLVEPASVATTSRQYLVCEVDHEEFGMTRDELLTILKAEGVLARRYFYPGLHRTPPYADTPSKPRDSLDVTDAICRTVIQLPLGALVTSDDVARIGQIVGDAHRFASTLSTA